jgi:hypothetical protein
MTLTLNYQKRKNTQLFVNMQNHKGIQLSNLQNYIPIYNHFFSLNNNNFNSINLNHLWNITDIKDTLHCNDSIYSCKLKNNDFDTEINEKVFFKMAPLLDPCKYIVGKYIHTDSNLFNLPSLEKSNVHPKMLDMNNSSYVDGFFVFLTSLLLNKKGFIHGVDYYGSFLAIKHNFKINIIDDIDYLIKSDFFNKQKNILFQVEDFSHLINNEIPNHLTPIKIHNSNKNLSIKSIHSEFLDDIFDNNHIHLSDLKEMNIDLIDITNVNNILLDDNKHTTLKSGSSCSSRTSHTRSDDDIEDNTNLNYIDDPDDETLTDSILSGGISDDSEEEEKIYATIPKFPVQVICMENCEHTFDDLIINHDIKSEEWFSAFMQIIMILITYQKLFSFTHNDLHTNNIMYNKTNIKYIYYFYKKKYYKVPTFGRLYKIIDFGRAIYKFDNKLLCSDSFQNGGDAATQYNTEPYFNDKKPRLEPNFSFDLCRLACSIFDYIVDDIDNLKHLEETNPVVKLIVEWCLDDNGINVLYKNNGAERYPDFKLYKMISRYVHNHTPLAQLERPEFKKYTIQKNTIPKDAILINIEEL